MMKGKTQNVVIFKESSESQLEQHTVFWKSREDRDAEG